MIQAKKLVSLNKTGKIILLIMCMCALTIDVYAQIVSRSFNNDRYTINITGMVIFSDTINVTGRIISAPEAGYNFNTSDYLGGSDVNASLIKAGNLTTLDTLNLYTRSRDFNLGNISNYTQYLTALTFVQNITNFLGGTDVNATFIKTGNLTTLNTLDLYIRIKDFNLGNISNYTQYQVRADAFNNVNLTSFFGNASINNSLLRETNQSFFNQFMRSADFNLGNISNDSLRTANNASFALWNISIPDSATEIHLFPRATNTTVQIGNFNQSLNYTDILTILGSVVTYGNFNATRINATEIFVNGVPVNRSISLTPYTLSKDFNLGNISNYTEYQRRADIFTLLNLTSFFGNDLDINNSFIRKTNVSYFTPFWSRANTSDFLGGVNGSLILSTNLTTLNTLDLYIRVKDFNLNNISNDSLRTVNNNSMALWNISIPISATQVQLFTRDANTTIQIGSFNQSLNYTDILTILGSVVNYGSFNATFINATRLLQGGNAVLLSKDFNLGNISNYTQYATQANVRTNITDYLGNQNGSLILASNLTTLDTINNYIRTKDFNLQNISNDSLRTANNASFALWNISIPDSATEIHLFPRATNTTVQIGNFNQSLNYTDILTILGSVVTYGNFNATRINATEILVNGVPVNRSISLTPYTLSKDFNLGNISNYTEYQVRADAFTNVNLTSFFGNASINNSLLRETNQSFFNQFARSADFNLANISNNTLKAGDNASLSLWNNTNGNTFLRFTSDKVGIGTPVPNNRLTIVGADADSSLATPGLLHLNLTDNYNNTMIPLFTLDRMLVNPNNVSTGAGQTSNLGLGILFRATNNDSEIINVSLINATLVNGFNGTEGSALSFSTITNGGQLTPKLVLNGSDVFIGGNTGTGGAITVINSGNVGIGTTAPNHKLDVTGTINASGLLLTNNTLSITQTGLIGIGTSTPVDTLTVIGSVSTFGTLNATSINATKLRVNTNVADSTVNIQGNISVTGKFNNTIGNFSMIQFNSSCVGFRAGTTGGIILSCSP